MKKLQAFILLLTLLAAGSVHAAWDLSAWWGAHKQEDVAQSKQVATAQDQEKVYNLHRDQRKLWSDHVIWTRQYIVSALAGLEDAKAASERLLQNQQDLGNALVPVYGKEAGEKLAALLKDHILIAVDLVAAAKKDDTKAFKDADDRWHANAKDIAQFLNKANPHNWSEKDLTDMFNEHLSLTAQEASLRLKKDWAADIANFDKIFTQALHMADQLADGIVKQFPDKF